MYIKVKRVLDIVFAVLVLIFTFPIMIFIAIAIKIDDPTGPVFFRQERIGYKNRSFKIYKFRTMKVATHCNGAKLSDEVRMLRVGLILRKCSLDELPQMLNILKGDMSFIGPRPLPVRYLKAYSEEELRRHNVRSGISGFAQINGRNTLNWEERFALDVYYVDNISFRLDVKILIQTIRKVVLGTDVVTREKVNLLDFDEYRKKQINQDF